MALKKKKISLKKVAEENTTVTKGTKNNQEVLEEGTPNDHHRKQESNTPVVGVNLGVTKNMDNYESLRVDVWLTDNVGEKETIEQAYERVLEVVDKVMIDTVNSYI